MTFDTSGLERPLGFLASKCAGAANQFRILGALIMREMVTRYGRRGLGFLWLVGEPMMFCAGVMLLWSLTKPAYEHGVRLLPFVMTGYMSLVLIRHLIGLLTGAIAANSGLLYHRQIKPVHILLSRIILEMGGATLAYFLLYVALVFMGQVDVPHNFLLLYFGWIILAMNAVGIALILTGLAMRFEVFERLIGLISYAMIPLSGVFFMVSWVPPHLRDVYLMLPLVHGVEMMRSAVFGEFVDTYYNVPYALAWGAAMIIVGLLLIAHAHRHSDSE
jgi:capsular polysaccharide transport system permease protein